MSDRKDLIDAARLEGIRLGLEAALKVADLYPNKEVVSHIQWLEPDVIIATLRNPDTIAREAVLDQLTREAQEQDMGYEND